MGLIPKFCLINVLYSIGVMRIDGGEKACNEEVDARSRKTMLSIEFTKMVQVIHRVIIVLDSPLEHVTRMSKMISG